MNLRDDSIDVLVKPESISAVKSILKESNVDFDVVIDNLQTAIDQENPKEDDDELENRNGKSKFVRFSIQLSIYINFCYYKRP